MDAVTDDRRIAGQGTSELDWRAWLASARLPIVSCSMLVGKGARAVVVAPHPDDEILAVGGLLALLARQGMPARVIAVTDGTASHRGSSAWPVDRLQRARPLESRAALGHIGMAAETIRLEFPDGGLHDRHRLLADRLVPLLDHRDTVFTTWRGDGHPDHEASGLACAIAAARAGAKLVEVPVWAWHWASAGDPRLPWARARRLPLDADAMARKQAAVQCFASQLLPDRSTGAEPILRASTLARAARAFEIVFV